MFRIRDRWVALLVGLGAFALYVRTLAPGLLGGDPGEFQFAAWLGGFAHPTGYPLYLMLGWLWSHVLPWGDPAWRMNLFSAVWGGVAVALLFLVMLRILRRINSGIATFAGFSGQRVQPAEASSPEDRSAKQASVGFSVDRLLALAAALVFAVTPTFWSQAVMAEVYTLHAAFVAALLLAALAWADRPGWPRLYLLAGLVGLSLAHHRMTLLLLPGLAVFLLVWNRKNVYADARRALFAVVFLLAPLLLYAYIPLTASAAPYFTVTLGPGQELSLYEPTLRGFLAHVSGSVFRSALSVPRGPWLAELTGRLASELTWPGVALGIIGAAWLAWRDRRVLALTGLIFVTTVGFNTVYGIGDIHVFYIPAYLVWALWVGAGVWVCGRALGWGGVAAGTVADRSQREDRPQLVMMAVGVIALLLPAYLGVRNFGASDRSGDVAARAAWETILAQPIPQDAILVSNDRDEMTPQWYLKYVEGRRPDLDGLFPLIQPGPAWSDVAAVADQGLRSGRPVYLIKPMPGLEVKFELKPLAAGGGIGALVRVQDRAAGGAFAHSSDVTFGERLWLTGYDVEPATVGAGRAMTVVLYWEALDTLDHDYTTFVHLVNAAGAVVGQSDQRPGGVYYPTSLWRVGERLRDMHRFVVASDPGAGPYTLEVGVYRLTPDLQHLGAPQRLDELPGGG